jgi:hypothetical protein
MGYPFNRPSRFSQSKPWRSVAMPLTDAAEPTERLRDTEIDERRARHLCLLLSTHKAAGPGSGKAVPSISYFGAPFLGRLGGAPWILTVETSCANAIRWHNPSSPEAWADSFFERFML